MYYFRNIRNIINYISLQGAGWLAFRMKYGFRIKTNYFKRKGKHIIGLADKFNGELQELNIVNREYTGPENSIKLADQAIKGNIFAFSNDYINYTSDNGPIHWHCNPITGKTAPSESPWYQIPDFGEFGDIKVIWELSRFPQVYYFINAYSITRDKKYAISCLSQIENWIDSNPYPLGPNWKCGQEITFRLFAWYVATDFFYEHITQKQKQKFLKTIFLSLLRIDINIDYAVKSVRNNHSISEAAGLFAGGLLFPDLPKSQYFREKGLELLLQETSYQVFDDGSYIQNSMNYHRLVLDVLSFVIHIARIKQFTLPSLLLSRHKKLIDFLGSFLQHNGEVPNYGANDGSYLFPVTSSDYRDYRPSLNFAVSVSQGKRRFSGFDNIIRLLGIKTGMEEEFQKKYRFSNGGYYILQNETFFLFIRCHSYRFKPSHNDPLHLDVWFRGLNIFCDSGTYSYNPIEDIKDEFTGISGHNTIMINNSNPMNRVLNFGLTNWIKAKNIRFSRNEFIGEHYGYKKLFNLTHKRIIKIGESIHLSDEIFDIKGETEIEQIWNTTYDIKKMDQYTFVVNNSIQIRSDLPGVLIASKISNYYNSYTKGTKIVFRHTVRKNCTVNTVISQL